MDQFVGWSRKNALETDARKLLDNMQTSQSSQNSVCFMWTLDESWKNYAVGWSGNLGYNNAVKANQKRYHIEDRATVCAEDNLLACKKGFVFSIAYHLNIRDLEPKRACGGSYEEDGAWVRTKCQKLLYENGIKDIIKDLYP